MLLASDQGTVVSRSDYGETSFRDWHPIGGGESGSIAPDPRNPEIVYAGGTYGDLTRYDNRTGQVQNIRTSPLDTQAPFPTAWLQPEAILPAHAGLNRFVWNLRTSTPAALGFGYGMGAIIGGGTDRLPQGPLVLPGAYQVRLIAVEKSYTQPLMVRQDPRVVNSLADLDAQWKLGQQILQAMQQSHDADAQAQGALQPLQKKPASAGVVAQANGDLSTL